MNDDKTTIRKSQETTYNGIAAERLKFNSVTLTIICPELMPQTSFGSIGEGITQNNISLQDRDGRPVTGRVVTANHLVATWEGSSNHRYPPMVEKGEPVEVYRRGNSDKFFWRESGRGRDFRKADRVYVEAAAGDPTKPSQEKNDTNTYSAWLDPVEKKMGIKSSKANGEVCAIVFEADLAKGIVYLSDDTKDPGNRLYMDTGQASGTPSFQINLSTGVTLKMEGDDLFIKVPGKMMLQADDRIVLDSPLTVLNRSNIGHVIVNGATIAMNAGRDVVLKAGGVVGLNALSVKLAGVVTAATAKITSLVKGPSTGSYEPTTISQVETGNPKVANNTPDVDVTGLPYHS